MLRALIALSVMAYSLSAHSQTQVDSAKVYADSMAKAVVAEDEDALFNNFASVMRSTYSRADLLNPLTRIRNTFGSISKFEYRNATVGGRLVAGRTIRTATCWYSATTTKFPTGAFLKIEVTYDEGRFFLAGYSVDRFVGDDIPPELRAPTH
jgi:hypothetical protein